MSSSLSSSPEEDNARLRRENAELREVVDALRAAQERHLAEIQELRSALTGGETLLFLRAPFADLVIEHLWPDYCAMAECCRAAREACGAAAKRSVADAFGSNAATALRTPWLAIPRFFAQERALLVGGHRRQYSGLLLRFFPERSAPLSVAAVVETCRSRRGETVRWSEEHNMAFLRGFFYVTGGSDALSCSLYMYNPCTRVWRECAAPPTQIDFEETGAQDAGNICAFGDYLVLVRVNHACQYSPDTDSWQMLPPLAAYPRCGQGLVEHHGALYVAGGCTLRIDGGVPENPLGRGCGRRVERFTTEGGGWQECGSMVRRRLDCKLFVIAGKLHASGHKSTMATSIERFDEQSNSWSLLYVFSDLNTQCYPVLYAASRLYFFGPQPEVHPEAYYEVVGGGRSVQLREGERYPEGERAGREERFDFDALVRREVAARLYVQQPDTSDGLDAVEDGFSFCSAVAVSPIVPFCHRGAL